MHVNQSNNIWSWYLKLLNNDNSVYEKRSTNNKTNEAISKLDTVAISREARFSQIERTIASGKPLTGLSFDQYCEEYYFSSLNQAPRGGMYEARQEFNQAVRGTEDIITKQDWYGEGVILSPQIVNSDAFQQHINGLAEKWANGEKLTEKQRFALRTNEKVYLEVEVKRSLKIKSEQINNLLSKHGIALDGNERIQISLYGDKFTVDGDFSQEKQIAIKNALNTLTKNEKSSYKVLYMRDNVSSYAKNISKGDRFLSSSVEETEYLLEQYSGGRVKLEDLTLNSFGQIEGLPDGLVQYFEGITSEKDLPIETDSISERNNIMTKRVQKEAMETVLKSIQELGYKNLPRYSFNFEFSGSKLKAIDNY